MYDLLFCYHCSFAYETSTNTTLSISVFHMQMKYFIYIHGYLVCMIIYVIIIDHLHMKLALMLHNLQFFICKWSITMFYFEYLACMITCYYHIICLNTLKYPHTNIDLRSVL